MLFKSRLTAFLALSAGTARLAAGGDEKPARLLLADAPPSTWSRPRILAIAPPTPVKQSVTLGSFVPATSWSFLAPSAGSSRLLFLSPLSPLRAALRVAAEDLAKQALAVIDTPPVVAQDIVVAPSADDEAKASELAGKRRDVVLRQRRKSVLNDREKAAERSTVAFNDNTGFDASGLSGDVELRSLASAASPISDQSSLPNGSGVVRVKGSITDALSFALTGLAAESAATTFRAGAEFEVQAGDNHRFEVGAVYGTRFQTTNGGIKEEIDRRSVGAFRLVHAMNLLENVTTHVGGRFIDAPFLRSGRSFDPEFSVLVQDAVEHEGQGRGYLRFDVSADTLFPGLDVVNGEGDMIALSEGLPVFAPSLQAQRTWNRTVAAGYLDKRTRIEGRLQDQVVHDALLVIPSSFAGAPFVSNVDRARVQIGTLSYERTFADGQAQASIEYGYGRYSGETPAAMGRDFHQVTTHLDAMSRRTGTGIAIFHRLHEGAGIAIENGAVTTSPHATAQRYLVELRQDVPWVPSVIGADMAFLVSLRNVYYDDIDRRNIDEFSVVAPPRRITGGIRVKF